MTADPPPLLLTDADLDALGVAPGELADAIEDALAAKAKGRLLTAPKSALLPGGGRYMMATLTVEADGLTVVKQVSLCPDNPAQGRPAIDGAILVTDARTGRLRALMGAGWITAHRTAALSAVAARHLADPEAHVAAFVGAGVQASSHLAAFRDAFPLAEVRVVSRGSVNRDRFLAEARASGLHAHACDSAEAALDGADIVVTSVTLDYEIAPFLDARWLKPGAFASITDLAIPWRKDGLDAFGTIVVDDLEQERASEKPLVPPELVGGDLTGLVTLRTPARSEDRPNAFVFRGIGLGDHAATRLALERAVAAGAGRPLDHWR